MYNECFRSVIYMYVAIYESFFMSQYALIVIKLQLVS